MEEESSVKVLSVSDLLHRLRPLTGASSLSGGHPIHRPKPNKHKPQHPDPQNPNSSKILKPLNHPTLLIGTLTVPSPSCSNSSCLKFSDRSAAVCCDVLDLDLRVIGKRIRVVAWNFLPVKPHDGFLEIIRWSLDQSEINSLSNFNAFPLNSVSPSAYEESLVARCFVHGLLESVSPVSNVPCTVNKNDTRKLNGFLAEITVCECKLCGSKNRAMLLQDIIGKHVHNFTKSKIVYFCGSSSIWYPALSRLVGRTVLISSMKKKLVFLGKEESLMLYVTTEKTVLQLPISSCKTAMDGRNIRSAYTGSVTGVYMQGMVIELDQKVLLLLTDHQLSMPHSLRIGAIVTVRNFHLANHKFSWTKVQLFGSCFKTSIRVNMFSPIESGCYRIMQSQSLLRKFIESLSFSARLWVLLAVSSLRKKFSGVLSEMEILGSKHKEGLVQKYSSSCLPLSVFRFRHGVLTEYCQHELCGCGKEIDYSPPKLVVPISNFISYCEDTFIKILNESSTDSDMNHQYSNSICGGKSHEQPVRKFLRSEDMNVVLLGSLKISQNSGRLQLTDATGSIDVIIPDIPSVLSIKDIYEINDFIVVIEGFPKQMEHLESPNNDPLSCRNIFNHFQLSAKRRFTIYINCHLRDAKSRNHILYPSTDKEEIFNELESGSFHLLWLVHKFPIQQKFPGDDAVSNNSSLYAEAIVLPWNLFIHKEDKDSVNAGSNQFDHLSSPNNKNSCDFSRPNELACTISCRFLNNKSMAHLGNLLNCDIANIQGDSSCRRAAKKLLLEFKSDSFLKFELLRIGGYYVIKHHNKDPICTANEYKIVVNSESHLWSVIFCNDEKEVQCTNSHQVLRSINGSPEICPDINLHLSKDHLSFLEVKLKELKEDLIQPITSIKELLNSSWRPSTIGVNLPEGNLLSVHGHVVAVHSSDQSRQIFQSSICIHVLVDLIIVKIYSSLSKQNYPTGFGPGVKANFHRVLLTAGGDVLKLIPVSFIEINSLVCADNICGNELDDTSVNKSVLETNASLATRPAALIYEMMQFSDHKEMRLHCRVVAMYVLVLEKNNELQQSFSRVHSEIPSMKIPLAGFIMDDGSSSCCCWTDNDRAATLLGLHERFPHKRSRTSWRKSNKIEAMFHMKNILDQHGTVVMKNYGSLCDSSCLDVAASVSSSSIISKSDEEFLKSIILKACSTNTWNIVCTVLDSVALNWIEERLKKVDLTMLPLRHIWASEVSYLDIVTEGRNILQEIMQFK